MRYNNNHTQFHNPSMGNPRFPRSNQNFNRSFDLPNHSRFNQYQWHNNNSPMQDRPQQQYFKNTTYQPRPSGNPPIVCHRCGKNGHIQRNCFVKLQSNDEPIRNHNNTPEFHDHPDPKNSMKEGDFNKPPQT